VLFAKESESRESHKQRIQTLVQPKNKQAPPRKIEPGSYLKLENFGNTIGVLHSGL